MSNYLVKIHVNVQANNGTEAIKLALESVWKKEQEILAFAINLDKGIVETDVMIDQIGE
jgi:hypothetical protein